MTNERTSFPHSDDYGDPDYFAVTRRDRAWVVAGAAVHPRGGGVRITEGMRVRHTSEGTGTVVGFEPNNVRVKFDYRNEVWLVGPDSLTDACYWTFNHLQELLGYEDEQATIGEAYLESWDRKSIRRLLNLALVIAELRKEGEITDDDEAGGMGGMEWQCDDAFEVLHSLITDAREILDIPDLRTED